MPKPKWSYGQVYCALAKQYGGYCPRHIVKSFATELYFSLRMPGPPFSPYVYARSLGIAIEHDNIQAEALFVSGQNGQHKIVLPIDRKVPSKREIRRRNFTVAHEVGHFMVKRALTGAIAFKHLKNDDPEEEVLCDAFASELLMPKHALLADIRENGTFPCVMVDLADRYDVSLTSLLSKAVEVCNRFIAAVIWTRLNDRIIADWASPFKFRQVILCDTGKTSVERVFEGAATQSANDSFIMNGKLTKWQSVSMQLPESKKVLTVMTRTCKRSTEYLRLRQAAGQICHKESLGIQTSKVISGIGVQQLLPFAEPVQEKKKAFHRTSESPYLSLTH
jgi:hypothetical protein